MTVMSYRVLPSFPLSLCLPQVPDLLLPYHPVQMMKLSCREVRGCAQGHSQEAANQWGELRTPISWWPCSLPLSKITSEWHPVGTFMAPKREFSEH